MILPLQNSYVAEFISTTLEDQLNNQYISSRLIYDLFVADAQSLCAVMMLLYFSVQSYRLMTGDGGVELVQLLRPFALSLVVGTWGLFLYVLDVPLLAIQERASTVPDAYIAQINSQYLQRNANMDDLYEVLYEASEPMEQAVDLSTSGGIKEFVKDITNLNLLEKSLARARLLIQMKLKLLTREFFEYVLTVVYKAFLYGLLYLRIMISAILAILGPFSFAVSIIPAYRDAYVNWITKYVGVMLYGAMAYIAMGLSYSHVLAALRTENNFLVRLVSDARAGDDGVAKIMFWLGGYNHTTSYFLIALVVGIVGFLAVPLVATWILGGNSTAKLAYASTKRAQSAASSAYKSVKKLI